MSPRVGEMSDPVEGEREREQERASEGKGDREKTITSSQITGSLSAETS